MKRIGDKFHQHWHVKMSESKSGFSGEKDWFENFHQHWHVKMSESGFSGFSGFSG